MTSRHEIRLSPSCLTRSWYFALLILLTPALAWSGPQLDQLIELSGDIAHQAQDVYRATKSGAVPNANRDRLVQAAFELSSASGRLNQNLQNPTDAETINRALADVDRARDGVERWLPASQPSGELSAQWTQIRERLGALFALAGGDSGGGAEPPPPPPPQPVTRMPPPVTRVSLIGPMDIKYASQDLSSQLGHLLGMLERHKHQHGSRSTTENLMALKEQADALGLAEGEDVMVQCRSLGGLISAVDRTISGMPSYPELRPLWVASRNLAMGIYRQAR
jgi:hypothetical protein